MDPKEALIKQWLRESIVQNPNLIEAFRKIDRADFVQKNMREEAYGDYPLPILGGQTISQPTTIMMMIEALDLKKTDVVLEIGAGSGYNAALMAQLCKKVYAIEIIADLAEFAKKNLKKARVSNVQVIHADGSLGYPAAAPYNKIVLTAAAPDFPKPLIDQLAEGGIILGPLGSSFEQIMIKATKINGKLRKEDLGYFVFVPLTGQFGHQ